jgi:hypothetical protein
MPILDLAFHPQIQCRARHIPNRDEGLNTTPCLSLLHIASLPPAPACLAVRRGKGCGQRPAADATSEHTQGKVTLLGPAEVSPQVHSQGRNTHSADPRRHGGHPQTGAQATHSGPATHMPGAQRHGPCTQLEQACAHWVSDAKVHRTWSLTRHRCTADQPSFTAPTLHSSWLGWRFPGCVDMCTGALRSLCSSPP